MEKYRLCWPVERIGNNASAWSNKYEFKEIFHKQKTFEDNHRGHYFKYDDITTT